MAKSKTPLVLASTGILVAVAIVGGFLIINTGIFAPPQPPPSEEMPQEPEPVPDRVPQPEPDPRAEELRQALDEHFRKFEEKNVRVETDGLLADYVNSRDTFIEWTRQAGVYSGRYRGYSTITVLYAQVLGNTEHINITINDYKATIEGDAATTTMRLVNTGEGKTIGEFDMEVDVVMKWIFQDGRWLIIDEQWEFTLFTFENVAEGTVFPLHWKKRGDFSVWDERLKRLFVPP